MGNMMGNMMGNTEETQSQAQPTMPWLERIEQAKDESEKSEAEKIDFITTLMELEFR